MRITLYNNNSDANVMAKDIAQVAIFTDAFARDIFDVESPIFTIETNSDLSRANYVYVDSFKRYYFIAESRIIRTGLWELRCRVDVLMSFAPQIYALSGIVDRSAGLWDAYLPDEMGKIRQTTKTACRVFRDALDAPVVFAYATEPILITAG